MIALLLTSLMTQAADMPVAALPCKSAQQIIAASRVSTIAPDAQSLGLELFASGLQIGSAANVSWDHCSVSLQPRISGGWAIASNGVPVVPVNSQLITRDEPIFPPEPEPAHPEIPGARFISSTPLMIGDLRAGVWIEASGRSLIARYSPGSTDAPVPILRSSELIIGVSYVGAPDAPGGSLQFWQRLPDKTYRYIAMSWTEEGVR